MEATFVSLIFFLATCGLAFFPFALVLWGRAGENPNVFLLCGALAMVSAAVNILIVNQRALGKALPRILASLGLVLAFWMITYPVYQKKFCPVCLFTDGSHPAKPVAGIILLALGLVVFVVGWKVTGWGNSRQVEVGESEI